jgi:catechol 2,3-dioxygenase-like lactoylglutathione lyase family enzyme
MSAATFAPAQREQANLRLGTADQASGHVAAGLKYFHLNLNVADVDKAVAFYKVLFGQEPFKHYPDFAEFVVSGPALVLDLTRYPCVAGGPINHIGLRFIDPDLLEELRQRLEGAGFAPNNQGSVNCCYAKGNKVWAVDPDHNLLELYVFQGDLPQFGFEEPPAQAEQSTGVIWEHRLPTELPTSIPHADGTRFSAGTVKCPISRSDPRPSPGGQSPGAGHGERHPISGNAGSTGVGLAHQIGAARKRARGCLARRQVRQCVLRATWRHQVHQGRWRAAA